MKKAGGVSLREADGADTSKDQDWPLDESCFAKCADMYCLITTGLWLVPKVLIFVIPMLLLELPAFVLLRSYVATLKPGTDKVRRSGRFWMSFVLASLLFFPAGILAIVSFRDWLSWCFFAFAIGKSTMWVIYLEYIYIYMHMYMHVYITTGSRPLHHSSVSLTLCRCIAVLWFSSKIARYPSWIGLDPCPDKHGSQRQMAQANHVLLLRLPEPPKPRRWHQQLFWSTQACGYERMHFYNTICEEMCTYIHIYIYIFVYKYTSYIYINKYINKSIYIYIYVHNCIHIYTYIYIHIHTLRPPGSPSLVTTILKWVCGGGWGCGGCFFWGGIGGWAQ